MSTILHLNLHRESFAQIAAGTKRTEYRKRTAYWQARLEGRQYEVIQFRNGYTTQVPEVRVEFFGVRRIQKSGQPYFAIRLGRVLKIEHWRG